jgi:murein L,D-transpeptidase YafK
MDADRRTLGALRVLGNATFRAGIAAVIVAALAGCSQPVPPHLKPLSAEAQALLAEKGMRQDQPMFVRVFKEESELEVWKANDQGRYRHFKTYPICNYSGKLGPKEQQGDYQAPEGFYKVKAGQMNPSSKYHLAFNIGFPNAFDRSHGRTGQHLMIHGDCKSAGCYAMTDALMEEIYILARESFKGGQKAFDIHAYPFRMTKKNVRRHRRNKWAPFWKDLKKGYDHFETVKQPPPVQVCEKRYLVNVAFVNDENYVDPEGACPTYQQLPREAVPPPPQFREAKLEEPAGPASTTAAITQRASLGSLGVPVKTPVTQASMRQSVSQSSADQVPSATQTAAAQATIGSGTTFRFAPAKPSVAGFAFRLNSKLDQ